jgi:hypothetical protein
MLWRQLQMARAAGHCPSRACRGTDADCTLAVGILRASIEAPLRGLLQRETPATQQAVCAWLDSVLATRTKMSHLCLPHASDAFVFGPVEATPLMTPALVFIHDAAGPTAPPAALRDDSNRMLACLLACAHAVRSAAPAEVRSRVHVVLNAGDRPPTTPLLCALYRGGSHIEWVLHMPSLWDSLARTGSSRDDSDWLCVLRACVALCADAVHEHAIAGTVFEQDGGARLRLQSLMCALAVL